MRAVAFVLVALVVVVVVAVRLLLSTASSGGRRRGRPQEDRVRVRLERRLLDNRVIGIARRVFVHKQLPGIFGTLLIHSDRATQDEKTVDETVDMAQIHAVGSVFEASCVVDVAPVDDGQMGKDELHFRFCFVHFEWRLRLGLSQRSVKSWCG